LKISDEINISAEGDAHIGTRVKLATRLRVSVSTQITLVKNHEETETSFVQCRPFSKQRKSLKHSPLVKLESPLAA
jgi:hypothetical protein